MQDLSRNLRFLPPSANYLGFASEYRAGNGMLEEEALWIRMVHRDSDAFEKLYSAHFVPVRDFLRHYLGSGPAVDDITQDIFLRLWQRPNGFNPARSNLRTYLFGIARKKAADRWRRHKPDGKSTSDVPTKSGESTLLINDALQRLDADLRAILWLREVEGYSYDELASILDIPLGTVKSRLFSAREQLRRFWKACE